MTCEIELSQGLVALVDDEDYEELNQWKWHAARNGTGDSGFYAVRRISRKGKRTRIFMAREIMNAKVGEQVDHKDGKATLNNQKSNLRICTNAQNQRNRGPQKNNASGYKGVYPYKKGKWRAKIQVDKLDIHLGIFDVVTEAALAYNKAALLHHREFAYQNEVPTCASEMVVV